MAEESGVLSKNHRAVFQVADTLLTWVTCSGRDHMVAGFTTTCAISTIATKVVSLNPAHDSVLWQVDGFLRVLR